jgi:hypothetical protein
VSAAAVDCAWRRPAAGVLGEVACQLAVPALAIRAATAPARERPTSVAARGAAEPAA